VLVVSPHFEYFHVIRELGTLVWFAKLRKKWRSSTESFGKKMENRCHLEHKAAFKNTANVKIA
jgi:hypothetical protein